jgi:hypothetical protein
LASQVTRSVAELDKYLAEAVAITRSETSADTSETNWRQELQHAEMRRAVDHKRMTGIAADLERRIEVLGKTVVDEQQNSLKALQMILKTSRNPGAFS